MNAKPVLVAATHAFNNLFAAYSFLKLQELAMRNPMTFIANASQVKHRRHNASRNFLHPRLTQRALHFNSPVADSLTL